MDGLWYWMGGYEIIESFHVSPEAVLETVHFPTPLELTFRRWKGCEIYYELSDALTWIRSESRIVVAEVALAGLINTEMGENGYKSVIDDVAGMGPTAIAIDL